MSGLLDLMRAAVAPTMAARTGYVQGQGIKDERIRDQKREKAELDRRSRLDQMQEEIARANLERAEREDRREQTAAEREAKAPRTPVRGTPEYEAMLGREERIRGEADVRYRKPERPTMDPDERDARTRQRQYQRTITTLKRDLHKRFGAAANLVDPDLIEEERRRVQNEYYAARADLAAEFEDVAPDEDIDPNLRRRSTPAASATPSAAQPSSSSPAAGTKRPITQDQYDYLKTRQGLSDAEIRARYTVR